MKFCCKAVTGLGARHHPAREKTLPRQRHEDPSPVMRRSVKSFHSQCIQMPGSRQQGLTSRVQTERKGESLQTRGDLGSQGRRPTVSDPSFGGKRLRLRSDKENREHSGGGEPSLHSLARCHRKRGMTGWEENVLLNLLQFPHDADRV